MFVSKIGSHHRGFAPRILPHVIPIRVSPRHEKQAAPWAVLSFPSIFGHCQPPALAGSFRRPRQRVSTPAGRYQAPRTGRSLFSCTFGKAESQEPLVCIWYHVQAWSGPLLALVCYLTLTSLPDSWIYPNPAPRLETLDLLPRN
jgi:hypothetical protein